MDPVHVNIDHARNDDQRSLLEKIKQDGVCPFCGDSLKYHKRPILEMGEYWILTENHHPYEGSIHHWLAISREHITHIKEVPAEAAAELLLLMGRLCEQYNVDGGALLMRFGDTNITGATVSHLHAHLIIGGKKGKEDLLAKIGYKK